jgi:hypothetical protein
MRVGEVGFQSVLCKSFSNILENMIGTLLWLHCHSIGLLPKVSHCLSELLIWHLEECLISLSCSQIIDTFGFHCQNEVSR